jgi:hypothetical protein
MAADGPGPDGVTVGGGIMPFSLFVMPGARPIMQIILIHNSGEIIEICFKTHMFYTDMLGSIPLSFNIRGDPDRNFTTAAKPEKPRPGHPAHGNPCIKI